MKLDPADLKLDCVEDKPKSGMWHCGPNPCWITVTHIPTMSSVRVHSGDRAQHHTRQLAFDLLELMLSETRAEKCSFPEKLEDI